MYSGSFNCRVFVLYFSQVLMLDTSRSRVTFHATSAILYLKSYDIFEVNHDKNFFLPLTDLYSPTYRQRYYDFLRYDFPRIPIPQDIDQFRTLAASGQRLIDSHLLKDGPRPEGAPTSHRFEGEGDGVVEKARYLDRRVGSIRPNISRMSLKKYGNMKSARIKSVKSG